MKRYKVIVADPAWKFSDRLVMSPVKRGSASQYPVLTNDAIAALPVGDLAAPDAVLALWCPTALILEGAANKVAEAWGFTPKGIWTWLKLAKEKKDTVFPFPLAFGMGRIFRGVTEHAVICRRGKFDPKNKSQRNALLEECSGELFPATKHSTKSEQLQDSLELMSKGPYLELFARRRRPKWVTLGNEIDGLDIRDAIEKLKKGK